MKRIVRWLLIGLYLCIATVATIGAAISTILFSSSLACGEYAEAIAFFFMAPIFAAVAGYYMESLRGVVCGGDAKEH